MTDTKSFKSLAAQVRAINAKSDFYNFEYRLLEDIEKAIDPERYDGRIRTNYYRGQALAPLAYNSELSASVHKIRRFTKQGWTFDMSIRDSDQKMVASLTRGDVVIHESGNSPELTVLALVLSAFHLSGDERSDVG